MVIRKKKQYVIIISLFIVFIILFPITIPLTDAGILKQRKTVQVSFNWQRWDILDFPVKLGMVIYNKILQKAESDYNVVFEVYELWDWKNGGDV
jgi:hypothetical protein